jgi:hypothetical protein
MDQKNRFAVSCSLPSLLLVALLGIGCKSGPTEGTDSETHFLKSCDGSCSAGLECLCGVCTRSCAKSSSCSSLRSEASCEDSCSAEPDSKICDVTCKGDKDCSNLGGSFRCSDGRCRESGNAGTAGAGGGQGTATAGSSADLNSAGSNAGTGGTESTNSAAGSQAAGAPSTPACQATYDRAPALQAPTEFDPDVVAKAAVVVGSCWPDDGVDRNTVHIWTANQSAAKIYFRTATQLSCLANANCGCAAVAECLGFPGVTPITSCSPGCSGSTFTACGPDYDVTDGYQASIDCSRFGLVCDAIAGCADEPVQTCDGATFAATCEPDSRPIFCDNGAKSQDYLVRGPNCNALGLDCSGGRCVGRGTTCTNQTYGDFDGVEYEGVSCSGSQLTACVGGRTTTVDCATLGPGFTCQSSGSASFCGLASECMPANNSSHSSSNPTSCSGTVLTFCNAGRLEHIDCTSLGFTGCEVDSSVAKYGCI